MSDLDFKNKKIMVVGAAGGIGSAVVYYLNGLGADLVLCDRDIVTIKEKFSSKISTHSFELDLINSDSFDDVFERAVSDGRKLDGLVYCAGVAQLAPLTVITKEILQKEMTINCFSFIEMVRLFSKKKYSSGGSIVAISSIAATNPEKAQISYAASKAALNAAVQVMALELAGKNIRINTVMPGAVNTGVIGSILSQGIDLNLLKSKQVLGVEEPEEIASVIAFLLSDMAKKITGRSIYADGGRL